jgi:dephospho-CoA kinase
MKIITADFRNRLIVPAYFAEVHALWVEATAALNEVVVVEEDADVLMERLIQHPDWNNFAAWRETQRSPEEVKRYADMLAELDNDWGE